MVRADKDGTRFLSLPSELIFSACGRSSCPLLGVRDCLKAMLQPSSFFNLGMASDQNFGILVGLDGVQDEIRDHMVILKTSWRCQQASFESSQHQVLFWVDDCSKDGLESCNVAFEGFMWQANDFDEMIRRLGFLYQQ